MAQLSPRSSVSTRAKYAQSLRVRLLFIETWSQCAPISRISSHVSESQSNETNFPPFDVSSEFFQPVDRSFPISRSNIRPIYKSTDGNEENEREEMTNIICRICASLFEREEFRTEFRFARSAEGKFYLWCNNAQGCRYNPCSLTCG